MNDPAHITRKSGHRIIGEWTPEKPTEAGWYRVLDGGIRGLARVEEWGTYIVEYGGIVPDEDTEGWLWDARPIDFLPLPETQDAPKTEA